jgi:hypothetical protein
MPDRDYLVENVLNLPSLQTFCSSRFWFDIIISHALPSSLLRSWAHVLIMVVVEMLQTLWRMTRRTFLGLYPQASSNMHVQGLRVHAATSGHWVYH